MGKPRFKERTENSSLNLENLPWTADRENQARGRWYTVVHKDDPLEWYRPTKVVMDERTVWTLKKYLNDQDNLPQYSHDDMLVKLGHTSATVTWSRYFGPSQNKSRTSAQFQQIQKKWMTEERGPSQNKAPTHFQQIQNKWMTEVPGPTQNKFRTPAHFQRIQTEWMTDEPGPSRNKAPALVQQTRNKWVTDEPPKPSAQIHVPQLSPIQLQTTVTDVLKSNLHVLEEYKRVVARASKISCDDDDDDDASPFVALMG